MGLIILGSLVIIALLIIGLSFAFIREALPLVIKIVSLLIILSVIGFLVKCLFFGTVMALSV